MNEQSLLISMGTLATKAHRAIIQGNPSVARDALEILGAYHTEDNVFLNLFGNAKADVEAREYLTALQSLAELGEHCHTKAAKLQQQSQPPAQQLPRGAGNGHPG